MIFTRHGMHVRDVISVNLDTGMAVVLPFPRTRNTPIEIPLDGLKADGGLEEILKRAKDRQRIANVESENKYCDG